MGYLERRKTAKCNYFNSFNFFHPHFLLNSSRLHEMKFLSVNWVSTKQISVHHWICWLILHLYPEKICIKFCIWSKKSFWVLPEKQPMTGKRISFIWGVLIWKPGRKDTELDSRAWFVEFSCSKGAPFAFTQVFHFNCDGDYPVFIMQPNSPWIQSAPGKQKMQSRSV